MKWLPVCNNLREIGKCIVLLNIYCISAASLQVPLCIMQAVFPLSHFFHYWTAGRQFVFVIICWVDLFQRFIKYLNWINQHWYLACHHQNDFFFFMTWILINLASHPLREENSPGQNYSQGQWVIFGQTKQEKQDILDRFINLLALPWLIILIRIILRLRGCTWV